MTVEDSLSFGNGTLSDGSNQFWSGSDGSRCSSYSGALRWSFASDGRLVVAFGSTQVMP